MNILHISLALGLLVALVAAGTPEPGALVHITYEGTTGVNLDYANELGGDFFSRTVAYLENLVNDTAYWQQLAFRQSLMMDYRLMFRIYFYDDGSGKGSLPLTPEDIRHFDFDPSGPSLRQIQGHSYFAWDYSFDQYLVTDYDSPLCSDEALAPGSNASAVEVWSIPVDPEFLLARTGYACMDEADFPIGSVMSENVFAFYDDTCDVETDEEVICHFTQFPDESCIDSLENHVGSVEIEAHWQRVPWDDDLADEWRFGENPFAGAEKVPIHHPQNNLRIVWKHFDTDACELDPSEGGCIKTPGWRRVLTFSTSSTNIGREALILGDVDQPQWLEAPIFAWSPCHGHYHFRGFSDYQLGNEPASFKMGFCLQDTGRTHNNEYTPMCSGFPTCQRQGASAGWTDDYIQGIPCNWVDITDSTPGDYNLTQTINPFGLVCEGFPIYNTSEGPDQFIFEETNITDSNGDNYWKIACDLNPDFLDNNVDVKEFAISDSGSAVTFPCIRPLTGPFRDCALNLVKDNLECTPGKFVQITLSLPSGEPEQVVRGCETSVEHNMSTVCELEHSLWNVMVSPGVNRTVYFACPNARDDGVETGGRYSVLSAGVLVTEATTENLTVVKVQEMDQLPEESSSTDAGTGETSETGNTQPTEGTADGDGHQNSACSSLHSFLF